MSRPPKNALNPVLHELNPNNPGSLGTTSVVPEPRSVLKKVVKKLSDVDPGNRKTGVVLGVVRAQDRNHWDGTDKVTAPPTPRDTGWWSSTAREFIGAEAIKANQNLMEANPIVGFYVNVPEFNYMAPEVPMHDWYGTIPPEILAAIKHYPMFRVLDGTSGIDDIEPTDIVYVGWENPNADGSGGKGPYIIGLKEKGPRKNIPTNKASNISRTAPGPPAAPGMQHMPFVPAGIPNYPNADNRHMGKQINGGKKRKKQINIIILHDGGKMSKSGGLTSVERVINMWNKGYASSHYWIDHDGTVFQLMSEDKVAHHASQGSGKKTESKIPSTNRQAIGIDLQRAPKGAEATRRFKDKDGKIYTCPERGYAEPYTEQQYAALRSLLEDICKRRGIPYDGKHIIGHYAQRAGHHSDPVKGFKWNSIGISDPYPRGSSATQPPPANPPAAVAGT